MKDDRPVSSASAQRSTRGSTGGPAAKATGTGKRSLAGRLTIVIISLLLSMVACEGLLRWLDLADEECQFVSVDFDAKTFTFDPDRLWRLDPDCVNYQANEQGLRGWWPDAPKAPPEMRIVCVGDSCTFGTGVRLDQTYGMQLAARLQREPEQQSVQCALFALPGYSTYQDAVLLEQHINTLQPDVTLFYCGAWNDYLPAWRRTDAEWAQHYKQANSGMRLAALWRRLPMNHENADLDEDPQRLLETFEQGIAPRLRRVQLPQYATNLRHMIALARAEGSEVAIVLPAIPAATVTKYPIVLEYRMASQAVAHETDTALFDAGLAISTFEARLPPDFQQRAADGKLSFSDWVHPSAIGHGVIARALHAMLSSQDLTPSDHTPSEAPLLAAPALDFKRQGLQATLSWTEVAGAQGYVVYYYEANSTEISGYFDVAAAKNLTMDLWKGVRFHVCVQAYGEAGAGAISSSTTVTTDS